MGTGSRKTWLERQSDDVLVFVLSMDDAGRTLNEQLQVLREKFPTLALPKRTAYAAGIKKFRDENGKDLALARILDRQADELTQQFPGMQPQKQVKRALLRFIQSPEFQALKLEPKDAIAAMHKEAELALKERHIAAVEEQNALKHRDQDLLEKKILAGAGGADAREIYLRAAKDVLKKLQTYSELKTGLDRRQAEIVNELAGSAETFSKELSAE